MKIVLITALGVGGATVLGALIGFIFRNLSQRFANIILAFASGVMLPAAVLGLILPSLELGGSMSLLVTSAGIFSGALCISLASFSICHICPVALYPSASQSRAKLNKVILFVGAIALHNFPEGIAAGVGFGTDDISNSLLIAGSIALQNIPEGMVIIAPMIAAGVSPARTFTIAAMTGVIEIAGTLVGYFAVSIASAILPFSLAFAGGTMLYVICDDMIPEVHTEGKSAPTYALLVGFCIMLAMSVFL